MKISVAHQILSDDGTEYALARMAPVAEFGENPELIRMYTLTINALKNAVGQLQIDAKSENLLVVMIVDTSSECLEMI